MHYSYSILFSPETISKAYPYANKNSISDLKHQAGHHIRAKVAGSQTYEVDIQLDGTEIEQMKCTCPVIKNCKHQAAIFIFLQEEYLKRKNVIQ